MSDAAGNLRAAADYIDDARTYLEQGDLGAEVDEIQEQIERADDVMQTLDESLREMAILEVVTTEAESDDQ